MDPGRFDSISRLFAERRLARRPAVQGGALAATGLATARFASAHAQEATPEPVAPTDPTDPTDLGEVEKTDFLFVQSFRQGSITANAGDGPGDYTITLEQGLGQTIYFSDRPERIVGASPTPAFLRGLGFADDNPPNAAILLDAGNGTQEMAVVELFNPRYDEEARTATYDLQVLEQWEDGVTFAEQPKDLAEITPAFGAAHLFIDDCAPQTIYCATATGPIVGQFTPQSFCYRPDDHGCFPCNADTADEAYGFWGFLCNDRIEACGGRCLALFGGVDVAGD